MEESHHTNNNNNIKELISQHSKAFGGISEKAVIDIAGGIEIELEAAIQEHNKSEVLQDLKNIINQIDKAHTANLIKNFPPVALIILFIRWLINEFLTDSPYMIIPLLLLGTVAYIPLYALAFESATKTASSSLSDEIKASYAVTLKFLAEGWKPQTQNLNYDSSVTMKSVAKDYVLLKIKQFEEELSHSNSP